MYFEYNNEKVYSKCCNVAHALPHFDRRNQIERVVFH